MKRKTISEKETFFRDREQCRVPPTHIMDGAEDAPLKETDGLFGAADVLSVKNAEKHRRILLALSAAGTLLTLAFLLYDEAEWHGLILACGVMILCLVLIRRVSLRLDCHRKYLQYRVLAESLRVQFFLFLAGIKTRAADILPWTIRKGVPWIEEVLRELPARESGEKKSVLDCWIRDQKRYHERALEKTLSQDKKDGRIAKAVLAVTIAAYAAALIFELTALRRGESADTVRAEATELPPTFEIVRAYERVEGTVASPRLDGVVHALTSLSRADSAALVRSGAVERNYFSEMRPDCVVEDGDVLTLRGFGKYLIDSTNAVTRRGRNRLIARKYI